MRLLTFILAFFCIGNLLAQQVKVSGIVTDAKTSEPIIGATVTQIGSNNGIMTDIDGRYTIMVAGSGELKVSLLGYKTRSVSINGKTEINISLEEEDTKLNEVIVLGYGQEARKANLSVTISNIAIDQDVKSRTSSLIGSLQGQIAGVTIANNSGDPLSSPSVTIRGVGSRNGDTPLYVVDGVSGAPFNMEDVESVTVLKDAASAAIYGTNVGSGGVILITTKKAKAGKALITARANFGVQSAWRKPQVLTAEEYIKVRTDAANIDNVSIPNGINPDTYPYGQVTRTNWVDEIFRTGTVQRYTATINGGTEDMKAYGSVEYGRTQGTLINTYAENLGARLDVDFKVSKAVTFSQRVNFLYKNGQGGVNTSSHTGVTAAAMFMPPSATVYEMDQNGNYVLDSGGNKIFGGTVPTWAKDLGVAGTFGEVQNPVATLNRLNQSRPDQTLFATSRISVAPIAGLKLYSEFSPSSNNYHYEDFVAKVPEIGKTNSQNSRRVSYSKTFKWLWETVASYDQSFDKHLVSGMVGYSMSYRADNGLATTLYNFPDEDELSQHLINGTDWTKTKPSEVRTQEAIASIYARAAYSYADRYMLTASIRRDESSKLYKNNNSGVFPAVSGAWKITSEEFLKNNPTISMLKLRASWGQIGNVNGVRNYSYLANYLQTGEYIPLGDSHQNTIKGLGMTSIPYTGLKWETSEQTNLGLDVVLLNSRLSFGADYFIKNTKDLIDEWIMPSVAGIKDLPLKNIGKVQNRGLEFTLGYNDRTKGGFEYSINGNLSLLKSEVKSLGESDFYAHNNTIRAMKPLRSAVGESWYSYYVIKTDGIFQDQSEIDTYLSKNGTKIQPNAKPGDLKFVDANGDGVINDNDRMYMDSYTPKVTYGINATFAYKNFDLSFLIQGVAGNKIFNGVKVMTYAAGQGWNMSKDVLDSWAYNHNSDIPLISMKDTNGNFSTVSDFFLEKGDYARLKNLTLGYTISRTALGNSAKAPLIRVYATGENLLTITKYSGMDPEVGNYGLDGGTYPVSRVVSLGLNVSF